VVTAAVDNPQVGAV